MTGGGGRGTGGPGSAAPRRRRPEGGPTESANPTRPLHLFPNRNRSHTANIHAQPHKRKSNSAVQPLCHSHVLRERTCLAIPAPPSRYPKLSGLHRCPRGLLVNRTSCGLGCVRLFVLPLDILIRSVGWARDVRVHLIRRTLSRRKQNPCCPRATAKVVSKCRCGRPTHLRRRFWALKPHVAASCVPCED